MTMLCSGVRCLTGINSEQPWDSIVKNRRGDVTNRLSDYLKELRVLGLQ
jgi:hypothetical protein